MTFGKPLNLFNMGRCGTLKLIWFKNKKFMNMSWNTIFYFAIVNRVKINAHTIFWIYACCNLSTVYDRGGEFLYGLFSTFPFFPFPFLPSLPFLSFCLSLCLFFLSLPLCPLNEDYLNLTGRIVVDVGHSSYSFYFPDVHFSRMAQSDRSWRSPEKKSLE